MSEAKYGLITIGNALVDVITHKDDAYLSAQDMDKGAMMLIDAERALALYNDMEDKTEMSGGSAGNTMACFASFGGHGGYIGKVGDDVLGQKFASSLKDMNVDFETSPLPRAK